MKLEIADILTNEKKKLEGFKVMGIFPFHLYYITTETHLKLCKIKEQIKSIKKDSITIEDFSNYDLQSKVIPLINKYCVTGLINSRNFGWFFKLFLNRKIKKCSHYHILNLYLTIHKLNEPAFFLSYWTLVTQTDNTLLKEE